MNDFLKKYWWVLLIVVALLIAAYFYFRSPKNKISFDFMSDNNVANLLPMLEGSRQAAPGARGIGLYLDVPLTTIVKNKGATQMVLNNIAGTLSYEGENILQTKSDSTVLKSVKVDAKSKQPITDNFQVLVNGKTIKYIKEYLLGNKPKLNYDLNALIGGKTYSFKDSTVLNESGAVQGRG